MNNDIAKINYMCLIIYIVGMALVGIGNAITYFGGLDCTILCQLSALVSLMGAGGYFASLRATELLADNN